TIDDAITQVLRGVNGLIEHLSRTSQQSDEPRFLIPVVFTTANLWVSDVDLGSASLETGKLKPESVSLMPRAHVTLQYPASEGLKHSVARKPALPNLSEALEA